MIFKLKRINVSEYGHINIISDDSQPKNEVHFIDQFNNVILKIKIENKKMIDISKLKVGDKVHYQPEYYGNNKCENGIVKEIPDFSLNEVRVVYNCDGDWDNFKDYTSALTNIKDLKLGWRHS